MRKLNVMQLMTDSKIGGAERVVLLLAKGLDKNKFNISVCCLASRGPIFEEMEKEGVKIYTLGMRNKWDFLKAFRLIRLLKSHNIHIFNSHLFHANILGRIFARFVGVPVIISTEHIMGLEGRWRLLLNKLTSTFVDMFIAVSFGVRDFLIKDVAIKPSKVYVVQNGIDYERLRLPDIDKESKRKEFELSVTDKVIGTVARIHKQKGHIYLLLAAREVINNIPEAKFLIIGDGPLRSKIEKLSVDLKIAKNVIFTGFYKDIPSVLSILDLFVLPSLWEGLPITILEAMAMKRPVIATKVGGNAEIVVDGITGILVEPKNPRSLSEAMLRLLNDPLLMDKLGNAGYKKVTGYFNTARMVRETEELYDKLIADKIKC